VEFVLMSVTALKLKPADAETLAERMRRLRDEAQANARDHTQAFLQALAQLEAVAADIAEGGEAYSVGVRETARQLAPELEGARLNVTALLGREG
jgi:CRP-like cAMP-binding protein